jgi:CBS domain-containing protein
MKELGKPPVNFAFISIGSAGREELTFNSDQDNAIIYENNSEISPEVIQDYFGMLSSRICKDLDKSGLQLCKGGYMASNPKWCQPISVWKKYFNEWIVNAEPVNIMNISVFFDLRYIVGEKKLFQELEDYIFDVLQGRTAFFYFLAQTSIGFKPPINVFGNIVTDSSTKKSDSIDIKNCLTTVIMFARIWALNNNIRHKGTLNRIYALKRIGILSQNTCEEVIFHYNYLMHLRLKQQLDEITNKLEITNFVHLKKMTEMEQMILKKIFSQMSSYEEKISATFMSGYKS